LWVERERRVRAKDLKTEEEEEGVVSPFWVSF